MAVLVVDLVVTGENKLGQVCKFGVEFDKYFHKRPIIYKNCQNILFSCSLALYPHNRSLLIIANEEN